MRPRLRIALSALCVAGCGASSTSGGLGSDAPGSGASSSSGGATSGGTSNGGQTSSGASGGASGASSASSASRSSGSTAASADAGPLDAGKTAGTAPAGAVVVDPGTPHQTMDGFGAADTWAAPLTSQQVTLFFDPTNGIGLSLLRIGIDVNGTPLGSGAYPDAIAANKFGVKVWGAPWSPPAGDKSNDNIDNGGTLNTSAYSSWAGILAGFANTFKQKTGFPLYAISAQNEPDFTASYASCIYSSAQMVAFVKVLGPLLAAQTPPVKLLAAEPDSWSSLWGGDNYGNGILNDPSASSAVNIIATHDYGHKNDSVATRPAPPASMKQPLWETEMSDETAADVDIGHGIQVAVWVYAALTTGGASAWHYWWLINANTDGEGLLQKGGSTTNPPKRLYTVGNFSKFVRPGYVRIDTSGGSLPSTAWIVAFQNPSDATVVVVGINSGTSAVNVPVFVKGTSWPSQVTPYVTSASDNLAAQSPVALTGGSFSAALAAQTVTTWVGTP